MLIINYLVCMVRSIAYLAPVVMKSGISKHIR